MFKLPNEYRVCFSELAPIPVGVAIYAVPLDGCIAHIAAKDEGKRKVVSVAIAGRMPTPDEITMIRDMFWDAGDGVAVDCAPLNDGAGEGGFFRLDLWHSRDTVKLRPVVESSFVAAPPRTLPPRKFVAPPPLRMEPMPGRKWCEQCERNVGDAEAASCKSKWCKVQSNAA